MNTILLEKAMPISLKNQGLSDEVLPASGEVGAFISRGAKGPDGVQGKLAVSAK